MHDAVVVDDDDDDANGRDRRRRAMDDDDVDAPFVAVDAHARIVRSVGGYTTRGRVSSCEARCD
jgi:hypothetical protein